VARPGSDPDWPARPLIGVKPPRPAAAFRAARDPQRLSPTILFCTAIVLFEHLLHRDRRLVARPGRQDFPVLRPLVGVKLPSARGTNTAARDPNLPPNLTCWPPE
jgi:hypothetical protein